MKKKITMVVSLLLVMALSIGGTLAYLTDKTEAVTNTFTIGKVDIDLTESTGSSYKIMPGRITAKDPKVTVTGGSENSYVFVKIEKLNGAVTYTPAGAEQSVTTTFDQFIAFEMNDAWKPVDGIDGVYYQEYTSQTEAKDYEVLKAKTVTDETDGSHGAVEIKSTVTMEMITALEASKKNPEIKITAYAIQMEGFTTPAAAWAEVGK